MFITPKTLGDNAKLAPFSKTRNGRKSWLAQAVLLSALALFGSLLLKVGTFNQLSYSNIVADSTLYAKHASKQPSQEALGSSAMQTHRNLNRIIHPTSGEFAKTISSDPMETNALLRQLPPSESTLVSGSPIQTIQSNGTDLPFTVIQDLVLQVFEELIATGFDFSDFTIDSLVDRIVNITDITDPEDISRLREVVTAVNATVIESNTTVIDATLVNAVLNELVGLNSTLAGIDANSIATALGGVIATVPNGTSGLLSDEQLLGSALQVYQQLTSANFDFTNFTIDSLVNNITSITGITDTDAAGLLGGIVAAVGTAVSSGNTTDSALVSAVLDELVGTNSTLTGLDVNLVATALGGVISPVSNSSDGLVPEGQLLGTVLQLYQQLAIENFDFSNFTITSLVESIVNITGVTDTEAVGTLSLVIAAVGAALSKANTTDIDAALVNAVLSELVGTSLDLIGPFPNTISPTYMPLQGYNASAAANMIIDYLYNTQVLNNSSDLAPYQLEAVRWLADEDMYDVASLSDTNDTSVNRDLLQRYVLAALYFATDGPQWRYQLNFLSDGDVCTWNQFFYDQETSIASQKGVVCNNDTDVIDLYLDNNKLSGDVPAELAFLSQLQNLDLSFNFVKGPIPETFCQLTEIQALSLAYNEMIGELPDCIGDLSAMTLLFLSNNMFEGELPSSFSDLRSLMYLFLDDNMFEGDIIQLLSEMPDLMEVFGEDNNFVGAMEEGVFSGSPITQVDLSGNQLSGSIPTSLLSSPTLRLLDLNSNELRGRLPEVGAINENLMFLSLYNNEIVGSIPVSWSNLNQVFHVDLSENQLMGRLPIFFGNMTNLEYLFLSDNDFLPSRIPDSWSNLTDLKELGLKGANVGGKIPSWLSTLTGLKFLDLDSNNLLGRIPDIFANLTNLEFLLLNRNGGLIGQLPPSLASLENLRVLFLDRTGVIGSLESICDLPNFQELPNDVDGTELLTADCGGAEPAVTCSCCTLCCDPDDTGDCNPLQSVATLNPTWESTYRRFEYTFGDGTRFVDRDYYNLNG